MSEESLVVGTLFDDRYLIKEVAGKGGMATVYRAHHQSLGREVALKLLNIDRTIDADHIRRFQQEAQLCSTLRHPNITAVSAFGTFENRPYVAFEFLEGTSLDKYIAQNREALSFEHFVRIVKQICDGLECAHAKGVVHRDLKPANIFLVAPGSDEEVVKIVDFGIAKTFLDITPDEQKLTATGVLVGTPLYMSPEQARCGPVDGRTDIYSVGCLMYFCIMGKPPFDGDSYFEILHKHADLTPPPLVLPKGYSHDVTSIVLRCLDKDPERRYPTVGALRADLESVASGSKIAVHKARRRVTLSKKAKLVTVSVVTTLAAVGAYWAFSFSPLHSWFLTRTMQSQWDKGDFADTYKEVEKAYNSHDLPTAHDIITSAHDMLLLHPSVDGARTFLLVAERDRDPQWKSEAQEQAFRILRWLPDSQWESEGPIQVLNSLYGVMFETQPDHKVRHASRRASVFLDWAMGMGTADNRSVQVAIVQYLNDTLPHTFKLSRNDFKQATGMAVDQWNAGDWQAAVATMEFTYDRADPRLWEFRGQTGAPVRAKIFQANVLAASNHAQQTELVLKKELDELEKLPDPSPEDASAIYYAWAATFENANNTIDAVKYFEKTLEWAKRGQSAALPLYYLPMVADGYYCLGMTERAMALYKQIPHYMAKYEKEPLGEDLTSTKEFFLTYSLAHSCLMFGQDELGTQLSMEAYKEGANSKFRSPYELWSTLHMQLATMIFAINQNLKPKDPVAAAELRKQVCRLLNSAAFHASCGRFNKTEKELRDTALLAKKYDLSPWGGILLLAGDEAAGVGYFPEYAESCLGEAMKSAPVALVRFNAALRLAKVRRHLKRYDRAQEALDVAGQMITAKSSDEEKRDYFNQLLALDLATQNWPKVISDYERFKDLNVRPLRDERPLHEDWNKRWREAYAFALRHVGRSAEADRQLKVSV